MRAHGNTISSLGLPALLACALLLPVRSEAATTAQYLGWGDQMLQQRHYAQASQYYQAVVKADPGNEAAYRGLGYCAMGQGQATQGEQYLQYALRLNPGDTQIRQYLGNLYQGYGNAYFRRQDRTDAMTWWKQSLAVNPDNAQLSAYVQSLQGAPAAPTTLAAAPAPAQGSGESVKSSPGINPWVMGGTIAALGIIMIFLF